MRRSTIAILAVIVAVGAVLVITRQGEDPDAVDIEALARRQAQRDAAAASRAQEEKTNLDLLAKKGIGQSLPSHLVSDINPNRNFWFVGKPDVEVGVEIPFEPGKLPRPESDVEPLGHNPGFLGADACKSCHPKKHASFVDTAHYRTSRIADLETISGPLDEGRNKMLTHDPNVNFTMQKRDGEVFQRVSFFDWQFEVPFDLIIGSSKMAETYLYWHGDKLYQHNCTYLSTPDTWINSPGYIDGDAAYARPIIAGCLECHTTYAELRKSPNLYTPSSLILGVSCERCHGPGKDHVEFHHANPDEKKPHQISVPSKLSREQQMDVCGQCHTGETIPKVEAGFQFRPGDRLDDHYKPLEGHDESANSVHTSNQVARISLSECFKQSEMACAECHDPHQNERGKTALFSKRCQTCHESEHCGMSDELGSRISDNCIDCHMPRRATENLRFETVAGNVFPPLRDHFIRVDQQATREYMQSLDSEPNVTK